ncbi:MAG: hypothetical protein HY000_34570 [Planctomycetes bacterium]|nr:hypothetical protein [Planctomycetota bacterium]
MFAVFGIGPMELIILSAVAVAIVAFLLGRGKSQVESDNPKLTPCPDCRRMVSRLAPTCPGCGRPLQ